MSNLPVPVPPPARTDALGRMLAQAVSWDTVPARTSRLVTFVSWGLLLVVLGDLALTASMRPEGDLFGTVFTGFAHRTAMVGVLCVIAAVLTWTALATRGFRYANHRGLRWWTAMLGVGAGGLAPALLAVLGLILFILLMFALGVLLMVTVFSVLAG